MKKEDRIWLAAVIDSEGSIGLYEKEGRKYCSVSVSNAHFGFIKNVKRIIDKIGECYINEQKRIKGKNGIFRRRIAVIRLSRKDVIEKILEDIFPYLIAKKDDAKICIKFLKSGKFTDTRKKMYIGARSSKGKGNFSDFEKHRKAAMKGIRNSVNQHKKGNRGNPKRHSMASRLGVKKSKNQYKKGNRGRSREHSIATRMGMKKSRNKKKKGDFGNHKMHVFAGKMKGLTLRERMIRIKEGKGNGKG